MRRINYILICTVLLSACKKEKSKEPVIETCGYAPYTTGSSFGYEYASDTDTFLYTITVIGDTLLEGKRFSILSSGTANQYIRCDNGRYYLFEPGISLPDYQTSDGFRLFLYDTKAIGTGWSDTINAVVSGEKKSALLVYTIIQKGIKKKILGQEYADVIGVRQDIALLSAGTVYPIGNIATYYYAKNVGYIQAISKDYTISLRNYNIK